METNNLVEFAKQKFINKNCDLLVANNLKEPGAGFKNDTNKVTFISKDTIEEIELMTKSELSDLILRKLIKIKGRQIVLIVIHIGNTNITMGLVDNDEIIDNYRLTTKLERTSNEYGFMLLSFLMCLI